jgi:osmotically-inducible protein OsmY
MYAVTALGTIFSTILLMASLGRAATRTQAGTGEYLSDSAITAKVKTAILKEPGLKVSGINVETLKGVVQLSGFVSSSEDIGAAMRVAHSVNGVASVKNDMQLK